MNKLIRYLLEENNFYKEKEYVDGFIAKYPEIYNNHPSNYYAGKCSIISCLFISYCIDVHRVKDIYLVRVYDYDFDGNMENYRGCHVVTRIGDLIYDMSYKQMTDGQSGEIYKIEEFNTWKTQWVKIEQTKYSSRDAKNYISSWSKRVKEYLRHSDSKIQEEAKVHYDDLHKFGYI